MKTLLFIILLASTNCYFAQEKQDSVWKDIRDKAKIKTKVQLQDDIKKLTSEEIQWLRCVEKDVEIMECLTDKLKLKIKLEKVEYEKNIYQYSTWILVGLIFLSALLN